ncbi:MAG: hypothetical protein AB7P99_16595 [Vicinamibacterales bacterium]
MRRRILAGLAIAVLLVPLPARGQQPELGPLLDRATTYVGRFFRDFSQVVATERYEQRATVRFTATGQRVFGRDGPVRRQRLTSDVLFALLPDGHWAVFRDVLEVDGKAVRQREQRIAALLLNPTADAVAQAQRLGAESARFNLEDIGTMNNPLLAAAFLQLRYRDRFRFDPPVRDREVDGDVRRLHFAERQGPTILRGVQGRNLFSSGDVWVEPTGRLVRTRLRVDGAVITTSFRYDPDLGIDVMERMTDSYPVGVNGTATYGPFRRFTVSTTESVKEP